MKSSYWGDAPLIGYRFRKSLAQLLVTAAVAAGLPTYAGTDNRAPEVPADVATPGSTNKVSFHVYAEGVQIYTWTGTSWLFQAPDADLYDADGNLVGSHYGGPTWESNSGSFVVGARVASAPSPNPDSVPLLLLKAAVTGGPGILASTTYVQRVNTVGGVTPTAPGTFVGEEAHVPYTAEYFFYRATKP